MDKSLELIRIPLSQIKPDPKNAKDHDVGLIIESFRRFGYVNPMVLNSDDFLLAGHGRRKALLAMQGDGDPPPKNIEAKDDEWIVPVGIGPDFDQREGTAYRLVDNRSTEVGGYDEPQLLENLIALSKNGGLEATGYDQEDVDQLFRLLNPNIEEVEVTDEAAILQEKWGTELGQLWEIGKHRLLCGDSADQPAAESMLQDEKADCLFTSPPYNVDVQYDQHDDTSKDKVEYLKFIEGVCVLWKGYMRDGRTFIWNIGVSARTHAHDHAVLLESIGLTFIRQYVWFKTGVAVPAWYRTENKRRARYVSSNYVHEMVYVFGTGELELGDSIIPNDTIQHDVFRSSQSMAIRDIPDGLTKSGAGHTINLDRRAHKAHPAVFPIELPSVFIQNYTASGEIVLDPFSGTGTTMIACEQTDRHCRSVEISPTYVAIALERMNTMGLEPKLLS